MYTLRYVYIRISNNHSIIYFNNDIFVSLYRGMISKIDQSEFEGFEYVNPLLMSQEDCV